jgi:aspartate ammonia-lyase
LTVSDSANRIEYDLLGECAIPACRYYGAHTARAMENFGIIGVSIAAHPEFVVALAHVKQAAAQANQDLGLLAADQAQAIIAACAEIAAGELHDQFTVDVIQGGAGTSTNMNVNEVVANRALELLGRDRGDYDRLHPIEHVNLGQSTNDVYPTAVKIAVHTAAGATCGAGAAGMAIAAGAMPAATPAASAPAAVQPTA